MYLNKSKKILIKIGSSLIVDNKGEPKKKWLSALTEDIKFLIKKKKEIIIVSSGAIAMGSKYLKLKKNQLRLDKSQAVSSIGQIELMNFYKKIFNKNGMKVSQILLTLDDTEQRRRSLNAKRTIDNLISMGVIPIVNENDTTATSEIRYGDNDRLASRVAQITGADCLILFSDVDGLYKKENGKNKLVKIVKKIDNKIEKFVTNKKNYFGSGGMKTKLEAAKICQYAGCYMVIANGIHLNPVKHLIKNNNCTWFLPRSTKLDSRKRWIVGSISPKGEVVVDEGAINALKNEKSLLPAGVKKVIGNFNKGDHILVKKSDGKIFARGLSSFSASEIQQIKGLHTNNIKKILGYSSKNEIIHKDDMVKV